MINHLRFANQGKLRGNMADMTRFLSSDSIRRALHYCKLIAAAYIDYFIREAPVEVLKRIKTAPHTLRGNT